MAKNCDREDEPSVAPKPDIWYDLRLGPSFRDHRPSSKFCTLRCEPSIPKFPYLLPFPYKTFPFSFSFDVLVEIGDLRGSLDKNEVFVATVAS